MFSVKQKREIAEAVEKILRDTNHPELPDGDINFELRVDGAETWSWAIIQNNKSVPNPSINAWNEKQDHKVKEYLEYTFSYLDDTKRSVTLPESQLVGTRVLYTVANEEGIIIEDDGEYYIVWDDGVERTMLGTEQGYAVIDNCVVL